MRNLIKALALLNESSDVEYIHGETLDDVKRIVFKDDVTDAEAETWLKEHADAIMCELSSLSLLAIKRTANPPQPVKTPAICFNHKDGSAIKLYVSDAGQTIHVTDHAGQQWGGDESATFAYVRTGHGISTTESGIHDETIWEWVQKWMVRGMMADGGCNIDTEKHPELKDSQPVAS